MPVNCIAARPLPGNDLSANGLGVPPALLAELGISPGALVELTAGEERAWANAEAVGGDGGPAHVLRLGRMLWPALDVKPDGAVTVAPAGELPIAESVRITPPFNLTFQVHQRLLDSIRESGMPLYPGSRVMAEVFRGGAGMIVRIDAVSPSPARLGPDTEVELHKADTAVSERVIGLADVGGADGIIRRLRELVELPLLRPGFYRRLGVRPPKGVLLYGPPGTGKTLTCKALANELGVTAFKMSSTELVGSVTGETEANLRLLFSRALSHAPALVMIDEFDVIATNRERLASQSDVRAASQLLTLLDGLEEVDGVVLVATTNRIQAIDPAFRRPGRFEEEIFMGPPDEAGRYEILSIHTREMPLSVSAQEALGDIAAKTGGFVGADLMHLARSAGLCATQRLAPRKSGFEAADSLEFTELAVEAEDFWNALKVVRPSVLRDVVTRSLSTTWPEIVGLDNVKKRVSELAKRAVTITSEPDAQGVLLHGPPGSGKSAVAHAIVAELGVNFVSIEGSRVFNQWLGESEEAVRALFRRALDARPSVLLLDHLDSLAPVREGGGGERTDERVVAALLAALDDTLAEGGVFIIATTSRPELVDPAVLRSGRIGVHIEIPNPDADRRRALLKSLTSTFGLGLSNAFLDELTEGTSDWSAADITMFVREGVQRAAMEQRELSVTDLIETLPNMTRI